ncbi:hypothetical protein L1787_13490 [Acuticoccus sp. M5D2P5]|uniref:hypothetical protein n=1 Tax=Acuticoccus kalidii TaxID=2910977 RepID=UPI001F27D5E6|nr:hypothetical protein [Acuticoccus kalidii]MCF3934418.1 hypothetical protein [Acuticoccus kalidii]
MINLRTAIISTMFAIVVSSCGAMDMSIKVVNIERGARYPKDLPIEMTFGTINKAYLLGPDFIRVTIKVAPSIQNKNVLLGVFSVSPCNQPDGYRYFYPGTVYPTLRGNTEIHQLVVFIPSNFEKLVRRDPNGEIRTGWTTEAASSPQCLIVDLRDDDGEVLYKGKVIIENLFDT